jgi:type II secretory pathway pseudopilin PulG
MVYRIDFLKHEFRGRPRQGFTILEVIVALFIFSCSLTAVMVLMATGDKINGRRMALSAATMVAASQVELLRQQDASLVVMEDTAYEETLNDITFEVKRIRYKPDIGKLIESPLSYNEYTVLVTRKNSENPSIQLRLLQGMAGNDNARR